MAEYIPLEQHCKIFKSAFNELKGMDIRFVVDIGSGRTSLYNILEAFQSCRIDAIIKPSYTKILANIMSDIESPRYKIIGMDICTQFTRKQYDLAVAHLTISRGVRQGEDIELLKRGVFSFQTKYLFVIEDLNDPNIKSFDIINYGVSKGYFPVKTFKQSTIFGEGYRNFNGQYDVGYLFEKK